MLYIFEYSFIHLNNECHFHQDNANKDLLFICFKRLYILMFNSKQLNALRKHIRIKP